MSRFRFNRKIMLAVLGLVVIAAIAWWQISLSRRGETIETAVVSEDDIEIFVSAPTRVTLPSRADLSFSTGGKIAALHVAKGDTVIAGQVLAELDLSSIVPQISQAEAGLKIAQANLDKLRSGRSRREIAVAEASVDQAASAISSARRNLRTVNKIVEQSKKKAGLNVKNAEAGISIAKQQLSKVKNGARSQEVIISRYQRDQAQQALDDANKNLERVIEVNTAAYSEADQAYISALAALQADTSTGAYHDQLQATVDATLKARERVAATNKQSEQVAESQVNAASKAYDIALAQNSLVEAGAQSQDIAIAESQLSQAEIALEIAKMGRDDASLEAQIDAAQAQLDSAIKASQVSIAQLQLQKEGARAADIMAAQGQIEQAQAALASAEAIADDAVLKAPFSGKVADINGKVGEIAGLGATQAAATGGSAALITLINFDRIELSADVDETEIGKVKVGQSVRIMLDAYEDKVFDGKLTNISIISSKNATGGTIFEVTVVANPGKEFLREGMGGDIDIITESKKNVLTIPFDAVKMDGKKRSVFVIKNGIAKKRDIKIGLSSDIAYEVVGGLKEGDVVAVGKTELKDGDQVKVENNGRIGQ